MNKIIRTIFLGLACTVTVSSCDPDKVAEPTLAPTELDFFSTASEFRQATFGTYATLSLMYGYNRNNWMHGTWLLPGDDLTEQLGNRDEVELFNASLNPNDNVLTQLFNSLYKMNQRANVVIEKVETVDYSDYPNAEEITMMGGEARFLRGYAYFNLFNIYGGVPIITERVLTREATNTPKSSAMEVLDQAINDFRTSIETLPESWPQEFAGRATKNSARGMLMKALVFRANYTGNTADHTEAISLFNTITASLESDFINNFSSYTENNSESLFEVQASKPGGINNLNLPNDGAWRGVEDMSVYRGNMMQPGDPGPFNHYATRFLITDKLLNNFGDDPRLTVFLNPEDGLEGRIFQKYNMPEGVHEIDVAHGGSLNNERVLRYSDVVLLAAEAHLKTGNTQTAIELVNRVRTRAREWAASEGFDVSALENYPTTENDEDTVMEWIMNERFVELAGEGHRFWDLKRWHAAGDIDLSGWGGGDEHFSTFLSGNFGFDVNQHLLFPLPQTEVERNLNITENNPGY